MTQLAFDLEALGLKLEPTAAMLEGAQRVAQHSWCGTVVVWPVRPESAPSPRSCPMCERPAEPWWEQTITRDGLAGLRPLESESQGSGS